MQADLVVTRTPFRVSVAIPCYNGAAYVATAVESAWRQKVPPLEVLVVDDGSTDASREIVRGLAARSSVPLQLIEQANRGAAEARNTAIEAASGDWIAFLDQDDGWRPDKLELQAALAEAHPEAAVVYGLAALCDGELRPTGRLWPDPSALRAGSVLNDLLRYGSFVPNPSAVVRRDVLPSNRPLVQDFFPSDDYDLFLRLAARHPFAYVASPLVDYRIHPDQTSWKRFVVCSASWRMLSTRARDGSLGPTVDAACLAIAVRRALRGYLKALLFEGRSAEAAELLRVQAPDDWRLRAWFHTKRLLLAPRRLLAGIRRRGPRVS